MALRPPLRNLRTPASGNSSRAKATGVILPPSEKPRFSAVAAEVSTVKLTVTGPLLAGTNAGEKLKEVPFGSPLAAKLTLPGYAPP